MPSRQATAREADRKTQDLMASAPQLTELARQQLASLAATSSAFLRALQPVQQAQQHMVQRAALLQAQTAERLRDAQSPGEVMAAQSSLLLLGVTDMAQYAQELMLASINAQRELLAPAEEQQEVVNGAASNAAPLFQVWQSLFNQQMAQATGSRHH